MAPVMIEIDTGSAVAKGSGSSRDGRAPLLASAPELEQRHGF
jgi:hypothetical protein